MGFFDLISNVAETVAKPLISFATGGPTAAVFAASQRGKPAPILERNEAQQMFNYSNPLSGGSAPIVSAPVTSASSGGFLSNLGQTLGGFGRDVGSFVQDISPLTSLFGYDGPPQQMAPQAAKTVIRQAPDETAMSGEILGANLGIGGALVQGARAFARSPAGQGLIGGGLGIGGALVCLLYTSPSPRDATLSRMPSSA